MSPAMESACRMRTTDSLTNRIRITGLLLVEHVAFFEKLVALLATLPCDLARNIVSSNGN